MITIRPELEALPDRLKSLPLDKRGYPVPWFVAWVDGEPEFRAADSRKWKMAVREKLCWVCGQKLGANLAFVIGPMCGVNRTTSEPPCHLECAEWSARNCPFLTRPHMVRRENDLPAEANFNGSGGFGIKRNPGCTLIWVSRDYEVYDDGLGGKLIEVGEPTNLLCYAEGRKATRAEVMASVESGLPLLEAHCHEETTTARRDEALRVLEQYQDRFNKVMDRFLP